jgi:predicted NUDIX family NTP pyrophosphohydrolase
MPRLSAGLIAFRQNTNKDFEVLLVHPGGPFYKKKDYAAWTIPKGEYLEGEDALLAAQREFTEETGNILDKGDFIPLQPIKIKSGKVISVWAVEADFSEPFIRSNLFEIEWPPRSGKKQFFPEVDKAEWFSLEEAKRKINEGQLNLIMQLENVLIDKVKEK